MNRVFLVLLLTVFLSALLFTGACKSGDTSNDITQGTWGFYVTIDNATSGVVYDFRGTDSSGDVYYRNEKRGEFTVSGDTFVSFFVTHYDNGDNAFYYEFSGSFSDFYNMSGSVKVTYPDSSTGSGTWTAER